MITIICAPIQGFVILYKRFRKPKATVVAGVDWEALGYIEYGK